MGNITRDIELRNTPKGTAVADIGLAVNRTRLGDNGEKIEETTFVDVTLWGRTAEVANQYAGKGKPIFIEGRLHMDTWQDKSTGQNRSRLKVIGENIQLIGGHSSADTNSAPAPAPQQQRQQLPHHTQVEVLEGDDIPF